MSPEFEKVRAIAKYAAANSMAAHSCGVACSVDQSAEHAARERELVEAFTINEEQP